MLVAMRGLVVSKDKFHFPSGTVLRQTGKAVVHHFLLGVVEAFPDHMGVGTPILGMQHNGAALLFEPQLLTQDVGCPQRFRWL